MHIRREASRAGEAAEAAANAAARDVKHHQAFSRGSLGFGASKSMMLADDMPAAYATIIDDGVR